MARLPFRSTSGHFLTKAPVARLTGVEQDFRQWLLSRLGEPSPDDGHRPMRFQ
ncbi:MULTISPECIES: hypothetical protein [unclassified Mesorhizobium]|uniref:hypothetical protein n=1 Tax=unclassified Mesorhizobium TaxID=325217 RepID=UPI0015E3C7D5|nr:MULTISPECIES: hypothetical protein [unclassified Mesorhizobium]MBZ9807607.1 hypothetical protein [Mesorhizobium sp. ESP-6-2]